MRFFATNCLAIMRKRSYSTNRINVGTTCTLPVNCSLNTVGEVNVMDPQSIIELEYLQVVKEKELLHQLAIKALNIEGLNNAKKIEIDYLLAVKKSKLDSLVNIDRIVNRTESSENKMPPLVVDSNVDIVNTVDSTAPVNPPSAVFDAELDSDYYADLHAK